MVEGILRQVGAIAVDDLYWKKARVRLLVATVGEETGHGESQCKKKTKTQTIKDVKEKEKNMIVPL